MEKIVRDIILVVGGRREWEVLVGLAGYLVDCGRGVLVVAGGAELAEEVGNLGFCSMVYGAPVVAEIAVLAGDCEWFDQSGIKRVVRLGQDDMVALEAQKLGSQRLLSLEGLRHSIFGFDIGPETLLVNHLPRDMADLEGLLEVLDTYIYSAPGRGVIITTPPRDLDAEKPMATRVKEWARAREPRAIWFKPLGVVRGLSVLQFVGAVVGNREGDRLPSRLFSVPMVWTDNTPKSELLQAIEMALGSERTEIKCPEFRPNAIAEIAQKILK